MPNLSDFFPNAPYPVSITPEVLGYYEDQSSAQSTTQVLNVPTHEEGVLLLACVMRRTGGGTLTPPADWDYEGEYTNVGGYQRVQVFTRIATASEPASYTWTQANSDRIAGHMVAVKNASTVLGITEDAGTGQTNIISMPVDSYGTTKWIFHHWIIAGAGDSFTLTGDGTVQADSGSNTDRRIGGGHTLYEGDMSTYQVSSSDNATICVHLGN